MKKLNKFEKRFVIVDIISTASIFGGLFIWLKLNPTLASFAVSILVMAYYFFGMRRAIWKSLEDQERNDIFNIPDDWIKTVDLREFIKAKKKLEESLKQ